MRVLLAALMVALVACTASAAPIPTPTAVSTPTATASDDELKKCITAIVKEFRRIGDFTSSRDIDRYGPRRNPFMVQDADLEAQCAEYLE